MTIDQANISEVRPDQHQLYRSVIAAMQEGVVVQDAAGQIIACNASAERILGVSAEQLMGLTAMDPRWRAVDEHGRTVHGEKHPSEITRRTGQPQSNVVMGVHKPDGGLAWVLVNSRPVRRHDTGPLTAVVITFADITERKSAESALQDSERRFRLLIENSLEAIVLASPEGAILAANPAACEMFGWSEAKLREGGRGLIADPSDDRLSLAIAERERTGAFRGELRLVRADGTRFPAEVSMSLFTVADDDARASIVIRDLTERRQAEEAQRERLVLEQQTARLEQLVRVSHLFTDAMSDYTYLLKVIAEQVSEVAGDACAVWLVDDDDQRLRPKAVHHTDASIGSAMWQMIEATDARADVGPWRTAIEERRAIRVSGQATKPFAASDDQVAFLRRFLASEILLSPLVTRGRVLGGISVFRAHERGSSTDLDASFLQLLAEQAASTIDNARLYEDARSQLASWRALVENAPDIISRLDSDLRYLYVNPAVENTTGLPAHALLGKSAREIGMTETLAEYWEAAMRTVFRTGRERTVELVIPAPTGERVYHARIAPEVGPTGAVQTVLVIARDVTESRKADRDRERIFHELLDRDQRLQDLVSRVLLERETDVRRVQAAAEIDPMTEREREILRLVAEGLTNQQIGRQVGLTAGTVKNHVARLIEKLRVPNRTAAAIRASELGLVREQ